MTNKENTPALRFEGFSDGWEKRELWELASEIIAGGDVDKTLLCDDGNYPVIANALTNDGIIGYYKNEYRIKAPAVTVTGRGDVGHAKARNVDFTPVVRLLSLKSKHDVYFLENAINTTKITVESTGVPQLTVPQLSKHIVSYPQSIEEETKIGRYFFDLDNLITLHQRKIEKLNIFKKSMLEKMFPKNGELYPEIRFAEFSEPWELREFDSVFSAFPNKNYQIQSSEYKKYGEYPVIDQGKQEIIGYSDNESKVCNKYPTIIFGDHTTELKYVDFPFIVGADGVKTLSVTEGDALFQYYNLLINNIQPTGYNRHFNSLRNISLSVPQDTAEQQAIGSYFRNLDNLISLHRCKLEKFRNIKKSMLEKMFV